jgi:hypothetical protein
VMVKGRRRDFDGFRPCSWLKPYTTSRKVMGSIPDDAAGFFFPSLPNSSNRTMSLGSTQPLTEMSTRNLLGCRRWPARKADITAMCEPIV